MRGATISLIVFGRIPVRFQLTRPMRGATITAHSFFCRFNTFQLTRPMRGATRSLLAVVYTRLEFQLTRPMRGATYRQSILCRNIRYFNSHAPCGAQLARRAQGLCRSQSISTHTPHAGRNKTTFELFLYY